MNGIFPVSPNPRVDVVTEGMRRRMIEHFAVSIRDREKFGEVTVDEDSYRIAVFNCRKYKSMVRCPNSSPHRHYRAHVMYDTSILWTPSPKVETAKIRVPIRR